MEWIAEWTFEGGPEHAVWADGNRDRYLAAYMLVYDGVDFKSIWVVPRIWKLADSSQIQETVSGIFYFILQETPYCYCIKGAFPDCPPGSAAEALTDCHLLL